MLKNCIIRIVALWECCLSTPSCESTHRIMNNWNASGKKATPSCPFSSTLLGFVLVSLRNSGFEWSTHESMLNNKLTVQCSATVASRGSSGLGALSMTFTMQELSHHLGEKLTSLGLEWRAARLECEAQETNFSRVGINNIMQERTNRNKTDNKTPENSFPKNERYLQNIETNAAEAVDVWMIYLS